jgi:hypothetical protein
MLSRRVCRKAAAMVLKSVRNWDWLCFAKLFYSSAAAAHLKEMEGLTNGTAAARGGWEDAIWNQ